MKNRRMNFREALEIARKGFNLQREANTVEGGTVDVDPLSPERTLTMDIDGGLVDKKEQPFKFYSEDFNGHDWHLEIGQETPVPIPSTDSLTNATPDHGYLLPLTTDTINKARRVIRDFLTGKPWPSEADFNRKKWETPVNKLLEKGGFPIRVAIWHNRQTGKLGGPNIAFHKPHETPPEELPRITQCMPLTNTEDHVILDLVTPEGQRAAHQYMEILRNAGHGLNDANYVLADKIERMLHRQSYPVQSINRDDMLTALAHFTRRTIHLTKEQTGHDEDGLYPLICEVTLYALFGKQAARSILSAFRDILKEVKTTEDELFRLPVKHGAIYPYGS